MMPRLQRLRGGFGREVAIALASVVVVIAFVISLVAWEMAVTYDDAIAIGWTRSSNLVWLLEEQTKRIVQAVDLSLTTVVETLHDSPGTPSHDPTLTKRLRFRLKDLPYVRAIFVVGADGFLIQDTDIDTPNVSLADRDYFRVHLDDPNLGLYIGQPLRSRSPGAPWFVSMSRRITLDDGRFYGIAVAALEPKYFAQFYSDITVGDGGSVTLIHRAGTLIARHPAHERGEGLSFADSTLFTRHLPSASGTYFERSRVDGIDRIFSYRVLDPLPLVVVVGIAKSTLLADWWHKARLAGTATLAVVLTILAGTVLFLRRRAVELAAAERLQQIEKTEAIGQMTSSVAHDFNNLLAIIGGNLEIVEQRLRADDAVRKRLGVALDAVDRGSRIVNQLLAFARRQPLSPTRENPARLVGAISDLLRQAARPCPLVIDDAPDVWSSDIDAGQFERAVLNLVINARDASSETGASVTVSLVNVPRRELDHVEWPDLIPGDYIACRVRDQGQGMPAEVIRRACEPFFTTKRDGQGTGLGLSQVFGFARQSGGGVRIQSTVGSGTTVTLLLPRSANTSATAPTRTTAEDVSTAA
jgi:signal transduction histidine kinase